MTMLRSVESAADVDDLRQEVRSALDAFLARKAGELGEISTQVLPLLAAATDLLGSGKRLRPAFCYWGWRGAGGPDDGDVVRAAASLELLQACALVHDDVMDRSDTRRGRPAAHRRFAAEHRADGLTGSADDFGEAAAILLGDLCLVWCDEMLLSAALPAEALTRAKRVLDVMRTELIAGQFLDLVEQGRPGGVETAERVLRFKSAKYTVERPLHLGAALAGAGPELFEAYSRFGLPLGEAFQLRDDVLGVFGDPARTGKPAGDDLREGKRTVLVHVALDQATAGQAARIRSRLGDPDLDDEGVAELRELIEATGARSHVELLVELRTEQSLEALRSAPIDPEARRVLADLAWAATVRET